MKRAYVDNTYIEVIGYLHTCFFGLYRRRKFLEKKSCFVARLKTNHVSLGSTDRIGTRKRHKRLEDRPYLSLGLAEFNYFLVVGLCLYFFETEYLLELLAE